MTDAPDAGTARVWRRLAAEAPRAARLRALRRAGLLVLALPGVAWLVAWTWAGRALMPVVSAMCAAHLVAIALAVGVAPAADARPDAEPAARLRRLVGRFADRAARLRALRLALVAEAVGSPALAIAVAVVGGGPPRVGPGLMIALASLCVVLPLERIARAQGAEGERLATRR